MRSRFSWDKFSKAAYAAALSGDHKHTIKLLTRNLKEVRKLKGLKQKGWTCYILAISYDGCKRPKDALKFYREALRYYRRCDKVWTNFLVKRLGWTLQREHHFNLAARLYSSEAAKQDRIADLDLRFDYLVLASDCFWRARRYESSMDQLRQGLAHADSVSILRLAQLLLRFNTAKRLRPNGLNQSRSIAAAATMLRKKLETKKSNTKSVRTKRGRDADLYFGKEIRDPYRWLEKTKNIAVKTWISRQNKRTAIYLDALPARTAFERSAHRYYVPTESMPYKIGRAFYFWDWGTGSRSRLLRAATTDGTRKVIFDSNLLPAEQVVAHWWLSPNGRYLAYALSISGSESYEIRIRSIGSGKELDANLTGLGGVSVLWSRNSQGFYYSFYSAKNNRYQIRYRDIAKHRDNMVYQNKDQGESLSLVSIAQKKLLIIASYRGDRCSLMVRPLTSRANFRTILIAQSQRFRVCTTHQERLYTLTDDSAGQMNRLVSLDFSHQDWKSPIEREELLAEDAVLLNAIMCKEILVCFYSSDEKFFIKRLRKGLVVGVTRLPAGTFFWDEHLVEYPDIWLTLGGQLVPPNLYRFNVETGRLRKLKVNNTPSQLEDFETQQLWAISEDGTRIPFYVTAKKEISLHGKHPTLLTGYGGFNIPTRLCYSYHAVSWLKAGGILVHAAIRGGGEYGRDWYEEGRRLKKQNCFDDFIAVAENLIATKFTRASKLGIYGFSNGGLLMGAALAQRPELFGATVIINGLLDMLRYQRFGRARGWRGEYGLSTNKSDFANLKSYSPLHNLKPGVYPPTLIYTGSKDDRVSPAHSYKFAARLQSVQRGNAPILLKSEDDAGHSLPHTSHYWYDMLSFFAYHLGLDTGSELYDG